VDTIVGREVVCQMIGERQQKRSFAPESLKLEFGTPDSRLRSNSDRNDLKTSSQAQRVGATDLCTILMNSESLGVQMRYLAWD
jgi:hypothetical protein